MSKPSHHEKHGEDEGEGAAKRNIAPVYKRPASIAGKYGEDERATTSLTRSHRPYVPNDDGGPELDQDSIVPRPVVHDDQAIKEKASDNYKKSAPGSSASPSPSGYVAVAAAKDDNAPKYIDDGLLELAPDSIVPRPAVHDCDQAIKEKARYNYKKPARGSPKYIDDGLATRIPSTEDVDARPQRPAKAQHAESNAKIDRKPRCNVDRHGEPRRKRGAGPSFAATILSDTSRPGAESIEGSFGMEDTGWNSFYDTAPEASITSDPRQPSVLLSDALATDQGGTTLVAGKEEEKSREILLNAVLVDAERGDRNDMPDVPCVEATPMPEERPRRSRFFIAGILVCILVAVSAVVAVVLTTGKSSSSSSSSSISDVGGSQAPSTSLQPSLSIQPTQEPTLSPSGSIKSFWVETFQDTTDSRSSHLTMELSKDGNVLAVGYPGKYYDGSFQGAVRVFRRQSDASWIRAGQEIIGDNPGDQFGSRVVLSGDGSRLAVGAPYNDENLMSSGVVKVFDYDNDDNVWNLVGNPIFGPQPNEFAQPLSLSSDRNTLAVSFQANNGVIALYRYLNGDWSNIGDIPGDRASLSQDGNRVVISKRSGSGEVVIYEYDNSWNQLGISGINGERSGENFGFSVSLSDDGSRVAIGTPFGYKTNFEERNGVVAIFELSNRKIWTLMGEEFAGTEQGRIGNSVSLSADGTHAALGAVPIDGSEGSAQIRIYQFASNNWNLVGENIIDGIGSKVSLSDDGSRVAAASGIFSASGIVRVFDRIMSNTALPTITPFPTGVPTVVTRPVSPPSTGITATPTFVPSFACNDAEYHFLFQLKTDAFGFHVEWTLVDGTGTTVESRPRNTYGDLQLYTFEQCIPRDCYRFAIIDNWLLDGVCCDYGEGFYNVAVDGEVIKTGAKFGFPGDLTDFGECSTPVPLSCEAGFSLLLLELTAWGTQQFPSWELVDEQSGQVLFQNSFGQELGARIFREQTCVRTDACIGFSISNPYDLSYIIYLDGEEAASEGNKIFSTQPILIQVGDCVYVLRFTLIWEGVDDKDIAVVLPNNKTINYESPIDEESGCRLEKDTQPVEPGNYVESIYCPQGSSPPLGSYIYTTKEGQELWTLEVYVDGKLVSSESGRGDSPDLVFELQ